MDLSTYILVQRFALPEPTRTTAPAGNVLAQEASAVTYNWDTDTLFITGDGGRSITEVSKTGQLISTMTLAPGSSPQGTDFYDPEGLTYIGNGQFVMTEERDRQIVLFTYQAGGTLTRANAKTVDLGTFSPNEGLEGLSYDPLTGGFILVKEINPQGVFLTQADFNAGTATNGSATTENSVNLFDPAKLGVLDLADVFALSNLPALAGTAEGQRLLVLSQESAKILEIDRNGNILSQLVINTQAGDTLNSASMQHEGLTVDRNGFLYVVNENGGGDIDHPQLWVFAPSSAANKAPTALTLTNAITTLPENTATGVRVQLAGIQVADDGLGTNVLALTGADAAFFEVDNTGLYIKPGVTLDFETRTSYAVTVTVNDPTVGATPDASTSYTLTLTDVVNETATAGLVITEVSPWSSGNSPVGADWFELTNNGTTAIDITGWKVDDSSRAFGSAVAMSGITTIRSGESVIFLETADLVATRQAFVDTWFGGVAPVGLQIGAYSGGGVGLGTGGDEVNIYNAAGALQASVVFGSSPTGPFMTFDNARALNNATITNAAKVGVNGAFVAAQDSQEIGSPGTAGGIVITEVAPWSSGSAVGADWFEITNTSAFTISLAGWKMDDNSESPAGAVALNGVISLAPGESAIFLETGTLATTRTAFLNYWFGGSAPTGLQIGSYSGSGVGLGTTGDAVNLYDAGNNLRAGISFGASPAGPLSTFDNFGGLIRGPVDNLASFGLRGAFKASTDATTIGSPGTAGKIYISEVAPWSSGNGPVGSDWFEVTNGTGAAIDLTGWKMDDNSNAFANAVALTGVTTLAPGESAIFFETTNLAATRQIFLDTWFGGAQPAGLQMGAYSGGGVGLGTGGDAVNLYDATGALRANVVFGASPTGPFATFENAGARDGTIATLSSAGIQGAFAAANDPTEIGSPGSTGSGNDAFVLTGGNNSVDGGAGNDILTAGNGNNLLSGGDGNDRLIAGDGNNSLSGGNGHDVLLGGIGNNNLDGGSGNDVLTAAGGNNILVGGDGNDSLTGGFGNNSLSGGNGNDELLVASGPNINVLNGGAGDDQFLFGSQVGLSLIEDFTAGDRIIFHGTFADFDAVQAAMARSGDDMVIQGPSGSITLVGLGMADLTVSDFGFA